jgi:uncharacterized protein YndB with AHSA1/START domain
MTDMGTLRTDELRRAVRFERSFAAEPHELWAALTESDQIERWLAPARLEPRLGGAVEIVFDEGQAVMGTVLAWEPPHLLEYEWRFAGEEESIVRFELTPQEGGTLLVLDHRLLGVEQATGYAAGWHAHLDRLEDVVSGRPGRSWDERFSALLPQYREQIESPA